MVNKLFGLCLIILLTGPAWAEENNSIQVEVLAKTSASWNGKYLPDYTEGKPEITILRIKIPPKVALPLHEHPVINAGVLLKGELTVVTKSNDTLHLKAGDPIVEVVDTWHYGKNEGTETAEIIVVYVGMPGTPITIKATTK